MSEGITDRALLKGVEWLLIVYDRCIITRSTMSVSWQTVYMVNANTKSMLRIPESLGVAPVRVVVVEYDGEGITGAAKDCAWKVWNCGMLVEKQRPTRDNESRVYGLTTKRSPDGARYDCKGIVED